ncbi:STAS domain-containing protein [Streptomyces sp. NPDC059340]|uniref:STAS domain-containing protein n=1 Tax=Streptomyces sp. NPDC059340 TaxID=3346806 RepID=UPI00369F2EB3
MCREVWSATYPSRPEGFPCSSVTLPAIASGPSSGCGGELASSKAPRVRRRLLRAFAQAPRVMEVDLGSVTYLAPEARGLLLAAAASARRSGACLVITHASPLSLRVLDELGMRRLTDAPLPPGP